LEGNVNAQPKIMAAAGMRQPILKHSLENEPYKITAPIETAEIGKVAKEGRKIVCGSWFVVCGCCRTL
jgi:hypothetical protein